MRLPASLSCAFCASIFSLSAWGYTTTWTTADYFDWTWPQGQPLPTNYQDNCSASGAENSACEVQGFYAGALGIAHADPYNIGVSVYVGADELASGASAEAYAGVDDWFAFTPDPGQNAPVSAEVELLVNHAWTEWVAGWRGTFQGAEIPFSQFVLFDTVPYTGDPFEVTMTGDADGSADGGEGGPGSGVMRLQQPIMLDAQGNVVTGTFALVPEPGYWPIIAALVLGFAVIGRLKLGRFRA